MLTFRSIKIQSAPKMPIFNDDLRGSSFCRLNSNLSALSDRVGHVRAALPHASRCTGRRIPLGLMLDLGVQFCPKKYDDDREPSPNHKTDYRAE